MSDRKRKPSPAVVKQRTEDILRMCEQLQSWCNFCP